MEAAMDGVDGSNIVRFPPKIAERSMARKLSVRQQAAAALGWMDQLIDIDVKVARGAVRLGCSEAEFRPFVIAELRKRGRL
jgi:hypothetical protein